MITANTAFNGYVGLSTDPKPEGVNNGSRFYEMDTQKSYMYDAEGQQWLEQPTSGGGGGSAGGALYVTFTKTNNTWSADKTLSDCIEAYNEGKVLVGLFDPDNYGYYAVAQFAGFDNTDLSSATQVSFYNEYFYKVNSKGLFSSTAISITSDNVIYSTESFECSIT